MQTSEQALRERAARGAELLDRKNPRWEGSIVPEDLDLANGEQCVLGQLYGTYSRGSDEVGIGGNGWNAYDYGFAVSDVDHDEGRTYDKLDVAWLLEIADRTGDPEVFDEANDRREVLAVS